MPQRRGSLNLKGNNLTEETQDGLISAGEATWRYKTSYRLTSRAKLGGLLKAQ